MSAPALLAGTQALSTGAAPALSLTLTLPSGTVPGSILSIFCAAIVSGTTWTAPAFAAQAPATGAGAGTMQLLSHAYTGSEGWATVTVTCSSSHPFAAVIAAAGPCYGLDPAAPGSGTINLTSTTVAAASITTLYAPDLLAWYGMITAGAGAIPGTLGVPAGYTAAAAQASTSSTLQNVGLLMAINTQSTAGATGAANGTSTVKNINGGALIGFAPPLPPPVDAAPFLVGGGNAYY